MKGKNKILVVDDDMEMRKVLQSFLTKKGYEVHLAKDATEACLQFGINNHDLVISDILMPGITGFDLIRMLKEMSGNVDFIIVTGFNAPENRDEALALGARGYFIKPFETNKLLEVIETILFSGAGEAKC